MKSLTIALAAALFAAAPAAAQPASGPNAFVRLGYARIDLADKGQIFVNGVRDPAAAYKTPKKWAASVELGYLLDDGLFALQVAGTSPVSTRNMPAGSLAGLPNLGTDRFSIFTATATIRPLRNGRISPYVGGGVAWQHVWSTKNGLLTNLHIDDATGLVVQGGADIAITQSFGLFVDAKKAFYSTNASGQLGPARVTARAKLDPLVLQAGGFFRF